MSADNWAVCPKCSDAMEKALDKQRKKLADAYGKVTPNDFLGMKAALDARESKEPERTMREDWDIGMTDDGHFSVDYRASCNACDFSYEFKHEASALVTR